MKNVRYSRFLVIVFSLVMALSFASCHFFQSFDDTVTEDNTSLSFDKDSLSMKTGAMESIVLSVSENQSSASIKWEYDDKIIRAVTDNFGAVITGLTSGQTSLKAVYANGSTATCLITVSGEKYTPSISNPYVYSSRDYVCVTPSQRIRISGSLFGGTPSDSSGFSWSIDNPSVASLSTEGNCCWITGVSSGSAKITLRHSKAAYPYSVLVDVTDDGKASPYITSSNNIITIDLDNNPKASLNVSLMNIMDPDINCFSYKLYDYNGNELFSSGPAVITDTAGNICNIEGKSEGECILRVTHPSSTYPLDIIIRSLKHSDSSYIELTDSMIRVTENQKGEVRATIANTSEAIDPNLFTWTFPSSASLYADYTVYNGNGINSGDLLEIKGKHAGNFDVKVNYPGMTERTIVVLVRDITSDSSKATTYVTTDQNFISMNPGQENQVNILLKDCDVGDINELLWSIVNTADDGSTLPVIEWIGGNGTSTSRSSYRSAVQLSYSENAYGTIRALRNGHATIEISHHKAMYSTKIDIVVKSPSIPEPKKAYMTYNTSPVVKIGNTLQTEISVFLTGNGNESDLVWQTDSTSLVTISPLGSKCIIAAPENEDAAAGKSVISVSHPNCDSSLSFTVYTYGTEEEYNAIPDEGYFYISSTCSIENNVKTGDYFNLSVIKEASALDKVNWNVENTSIINVDTQDDGFLRLQAMKAGKTTVTASREGYPELTFIIKVTDRNVISEDKDIYLTTSNNIVYFESLDDKDRTVSVTLQNYSDDSGIIWTCSDPNLFSVSPSGRTASVSPLLPNSSAVITVSHPLSQNSVEIRLKCGELYDYKNPDCVLIEPSEKVLNLIAGAKEKIFTAAIIHSSGQNTNEEEKYFTFSSSDSEIAEVNYVTGTSTCFIRPLKEGKATLLIKNSKVDFDCEVPLIISKPENFENTPYLSTDSNIITVIEGEMEPVSVSVFNNPDSDSFGSYKFHWNCLDGTNYAQAIAQNGMTAMIKANSPGIQRIEVTHDDCPYPLSLIVNVLPLDSVKARPYIKLDHNIITIKKNESVTVKASMLGGVSESADNPFFTWTAGDSSTVLINPTENSCYIKGLNTGMTKITIRNSKYPSSYVRDVLVIVEDVSQEGIYIKPSVSTLRINPTYKGLTMLSASLINGEPTDAADFIWWADDYSLLLTTSIAGECSVTPKGLSGSTYIHVKHPKARDVCDILVTVSEYENFAFANTSMVLRSGKIYFVPLQVPVQDSEYVIDYESTDNEICCIAGSRQTAYLAARHAGSVNVTATMKTSSGEVISQAQMLLTVQEDDVRIPDIAVGNTCIYEMSEGEDMLLNGIITGGDISEGEKYHLKWEILGNNSGLSLVNANADGTFTGSDCLVSALKVIGTKEFVIRVSHAQSGAETYLYFVVTEKGVLTIKLSTMFEQVYKSDGTFKITATVENGSPSDAKNINWSTVRQDGVQIVSVSKSKGNTCTVTPKNEGMTVVRASLPGAETKDCQVVVMPDATIKLATSNVHVMPGETIEVDYYTEPARCSIQWVEEMTGNVGYLGGTQEQYFTFEVNEAEKKLSITGKTALNGNVAGTIKGLMTSNKCSTIPVLNVFVDYDTNMKIMDKSRKNYLNQIINNAAKGAKKLDRYYFNVSYFPAKMELTLSMDNNIVKQGAISYKEEKNEYGMKEKIAYVELIPVLEGNCNITVTATLYDDKTHNVIKSETKTIYYSSYYQDYSVKINSESAAGAWSKVKDDGSFLICDGEELRFYVDIENENCAGQITSITWQPLNTLQGSDIIEFQKGQYRGSEPSRESLKNILFNDSNDNNGRKLYCSIPKTGFISLDEYAGSTASGQTKKMYRFAHNFDYYKDLPGLTPETNNKIHSIPASSGGNIINYIEDPDFDYYLVEQDMIWRVNDDKGNRILDTKSWNNQGIVSWDAVANNGTAWQFAGIFGNTSYGLAFFMANFKDISFDYSKNLYVVKEKYDYDLGNGGYSVYYGYRGSQEIHVYPNAQDFYLGKERILAQPYLQSPYIFLTFDASFNNFKGYATETSSTGVGNLLLKENIPNNYSGCRYFDDYTTTEVYTSAKNYTKEGTENVYLKDTKTKILRKGNKYSFLNYYDFDKQSLKYPTSSQNVYRNNNSKDGYLYIDYIDANYIISKHNLLNNSNYVIAKVDSEDKLSNLTLSVSGQSNSHNIGDWDTHNYKCTYTIKPTLMHEHVKPCINPNPAVVKGGENYQIGNIVIEINLASNGQEKACPSKVIPVYYEKRDCQAYQSGDWKNKGNYFIRE